MGRCTTRPSGRGRTTPGFAVSGSKAGRSQSCSTSATAGCSTRRPGGMRSTRRSPRLPLPSRTSMSSAGSSVSAASPRSRRFALTVELDDWSRFRPESLGPFLGLTPSENSSRERRRQGGITKTGNTNARRLLVEAAWHQRRPPRMSAVLARRRSGNPVAVQAQADRSARRLHGRWHALEARGKPRSIVVVAVARELAGTLLGARDDGVAAPPTARRGERTGATTRGATRENTVSSPHRPRSTPENGTAPHLAHPVMRHQPAHMSRDTDVDDSRCAPPADPNPANSGATKPLRG